MNQTFIKPITLGGVQFESNLIQAPLAGVSCAPFRDMIWQYGELAYCATEMVSAKTLLLAKPPKRYIYKSATEGPLCFQLSGTNPEELHRAVDIAILHGADLIDLNCGCPMPKVRHRGCGSRLLSDSSKLYQLVTTLRKATDKPLSIKIRVDGQSGDRFNADVIKAVNDGGADFIVVHGRHWTEDYETEVRYDEIAATVQASKIPVIGNGNVKNYASLQRLMETGCAGAMIGRGSTGKPWLFAELSANDKGLTFTPPSSIEIGKLFLLHIEKLIALENEPRALLQGRQFSKYYARAAGLGPEVYLQFYTVKSLEELRMLIDACFI
ncbi:MAG: tRNA-dihydrouridine synthase family protein [Gammaproteobacteria bacterium]|nr:tRNA-dihydrouridine synthase family protein [Gammaproteobacteria bacterium]